MEKTALHAKWRDLLASQAESGQSKKAFCLTHGLNPATFYYWQRRFQELEEASTIGFRSVQLKEEHEVCFELGTRQVVLSSPSERTLAGIISTLFDA